MANTTRTTEATMTGAEVIRSLFDKARRRDDAYFSSFTDDALYQVANYPPAHGEQEIRAFLKPILELCEGVDHNIDRMWEIERNRFALQGSVDYHRRDGRKVPRIQTCNIITVEGDKISELRAYGDFTPLFNPPA